MFCTECGTQLPDGADKCAACGKSVNAVTDGSMSGITKPVSPFQSGNDPAELDQVRGWNWGAFFLPLFWSAAHKLWACAALSSLLPIVFIAGEHYYGPKASTIEYKLAHLLLSVMLFVNIAIRIYVGVKGRELAWKTRPFESVLKFKATQSSWTTVGVLVFLWILFAAAAMLRTFKAIDHGNFSAANETIAAMKTSVEIVAADNPGTITGTGHYTNAAWDKNNLCYEMLGSDAPCENAVAGKAALKARIDINVLNFSMTIKSVDGKPDSTYVIKGEAKDKWHCKICATPNGIFPEEYNEKDCAAGTCP